jgi:hypothetical protein
MFLFIDILGRIASAFSLEKKSKTDTLLVILPEQNLTEIPNSLANLNNYKIRQKKK